MKTLTTGTSSGLGKYIHKNLGGIGLIRSTSLEEVKKIKHKGADIIIHCAFNPSREVSSNSFSQYLQDNVLLTKELVSFPHKKFIFFSSVDVYPKDGRLHSEDEVIDVNSVNGMYAVTKLMSESIIKNSCRNYLILRGTAFLGKYSRRNSLISIVKDKKCILTLSGDSKFNYILHSDILDFIKFSIGHDLKGIYNLVSANNIALTEVANILGKKVKFGSYFYDVGNMNNSKISSVFPPFKKTSREVIVQYIRERYE